jgi:hypothetical protein
MNAINRKIPVGLLRELLIAAAAGADNWLPTDTAEIPPEVSRFLAGCIQNHPDPQVKAWALNELKGG